jgi:hypothetical protein
MGRSVTSRERRPTGKGTTSFGAEAPSDGTAPGFETPQQSVTRRSQRHVVVGGDVAASPTGTLPTATDPKVKTLDSTSSPTIGIGGHAVETSPDATPVTVPPRHSVASVGDVPSGTAVTEPETDAAQHPLVLGIDRTPRGDHSITMWMLLAVDS